MTGEGERALCRCAPSRAGLDAPVWTLDGRDWPNREASRFVEAGGLTWHVQDMGTGPVVLLVHGTGAATHSWRDLAPLLATRFRVVAPDLPGHGFTEAPRRGGMTLPWMAHALDRLLRVLDVRPELAVGHSAGAAILLRMCLDGAIQPAAVVSLNGALLPFDGLAGQLFAPVARLLGRSALVPRVFSWRAGDRAAVARLIRGTGSTLEPESLDFYARLFRRPAHAAAALRMMANWDLRALRCELDRLQPELVLVVGENDTAVPPAQAETVAPLVPRARLVRLPGLGHLAHEEDPKAIAAMLRRSAQAAGVLSQA